MALRTRSSRRAGAPVPTTSAPTRLWDMERSLRRRGFAAVAGADEAGRGACAGPLVAAACVLPAGQARPRARAGRLQAAHRRRRASASTPRSSTGRCPGRSSSSRSSELDARGMHVTNLEALRRAVVTLDPGAGLRADRRLPGARPRPAGPRRVEGRPRRRLRGRGVGAGEGHPGPDDGGAARAVARVRLRRPQGLHHRRAHRRAGAARAVPGAPDALRQRGAAPGTRTSPGASSVTVPVAMDDDGDMRPESCEPRRAPGTDEHRGSREVRDRDGAAALSRVPGHRPPVHLRRGDRAAVLPGQLRRPPGPRGRW